LARERLIGVLSFAIPFAVVWLFAQFVFGWPLHQAQIAGIALSTTSVAVVYAVMIEGGFSDTAMGKMILAASLLPISERCWRSAPFSPTTISGCCYL
jgi:Kef-type K+ transport system membrane component KefB